MILRPFGIAAVIADMLGRTVNRRVVRQAADTCGFMGERTFCSLTTMHIAPQHRENCQCVRCHKIYSSLNHSRTYHLSPRNDSLLVVGGALLTAGIIAQYGHKIYVQSQERKKLQEETDKGHLNTNEEAPSVEKEQGAREEVKAESKTEQTQEKQKQSEQSGSFSFASGWFTKSFYDGGKLSRVGRVM